MSYSHRYDAAAQINAQIVQRLRQIEIALRLLHQLAITVTTVIQPIRTQPAQPNERNVGQMNLRVIGGNAPDISLPILDFQLVRLWQWDSKVLSIYQRPGQAFKSTLIAN